MICTACTTAMNPIGTLSPYTDTDWQFPIFDCPTCGMRSAARDDNKKYHEILHDQEVGGYGDHYVLAEQIKTALAQNDMNACLTLLPPKTPTGHIIRTLLNAKKPARILEVGCSSGYLTAMLRYVGHEAYGTDISDHAIKKATDLFGQWFSTDIPEGPFDYIFFMGVVGCVDNPKEFLHTYLAHLAEGGTMLFNAPNKQRLTKMDALWGSTPPPDLVHFFDMDKTLPYLVNPQTHTYSVKRLHSYTTLGKQWLRDEQSDLFKERTLQTQTQKPTKNTPKRREKIVSAISALAGFIGYHGHLHRHEGLYDSIVEIRGL